MTTPNRSRRIVKLAATKTEVDALKLWFEHDATGQWEREAADLLEKTAKRATELGMDEKSVDDEIADRLAFRGAVALLAEADKISRKKRRTR